MRSLCRTIALETPFARPALLIMCPMLVACGGEDELIAPPPVVASVDVTPQTATIPTLGWRAQLSAVARDSNGSVILGADIQWSSSADAVATVDSSGLVTAAGNGSADITASADGASGTATVVVRQEPAYLEFTSTPPVTVVGHVIGPVVEVAIKDWGGSTVGDATDMVTVAIDSNPGSAVLGGTTTVSPVGGLARFSNLFIDRVARGYTLVATASRLYRATSAAFDIWRSPARIDSVQFLQHPPRTADTLYIDRFRLVSAVSVTSIAGSTMSAVALRGYIDQGTASRAAGETDVVCTDMPGDVPPGTCAFNYALGASNTASGSGTLVAGGATARFDLVDVIGDTLLDSLTRPVTLVEAVEPPLPRARIDSTNLRSTRLTIGTAVTYEATVTNEESDTLVSARLQVWVDQGFASRNGLGTNVNCGATSGDLPPGTCSFLSFLKAWNSGGFGTLLPGDATARFELKDMYDRVVDTFFVPVRLYLY